MLHYYKKPIIIFDRQGEAMKLDINAVAPNSENAKSFLSRKNYQMLINNNWVSPDDGADLDELDIDTKYIGGGLRVNLGNIIYDY